MNFNSVWIPETKAHREMDDTNKSVQPYLITTQVKNKDIYVMRNNKCSTSWNVAVYNKAFEGNFSTLCSILRC